MHVSNIELVALIAAYRYVRVRSVMNKNMQLISTKCKIDIVLLLRDKAHSCALKVNTTEENADTISMLKNLEPLSRVWKGVYTIPCFSEEEIQNM